jgi:Sulfotransferase family
MTDLDPLSTASLFEDACAVSGLSDWGDLTFAATVELLMDSCRATAALTPAGWVLLRKVALRHLRNQLYLQEFVSAHEGVYGEPITSPVVITGLPRTGTTLLHNLLALDPANRVLRFWEALHPVPADPSTAPARVQQAEMWLARTYELTPTFRAIHASTAEGPEECDALLQNAFASQHFDDMFRAEEYSAWLNNASLADEYQYFARQLQVLTRPEERERPWVLKSPSHLGYLDTVTQTFPGAMIVHCHREPLEAIASYASLTYAVRAPHSDNTSLVDVGTHVLNRCAIAMKRALQARDALADDALVDVGYTALVRHPLGVVRDLYDRLGRALSTEAAAAMEQWVTENPQHRFGRHEYTLARFGLSPADVSTALEEYCDRFAAEIA